jgi:hypothetical protein
MNPEIYVLDGPSNRTKTTSKAQPRFLASREQVLEALRRSTVRHVWIVASKSRFPDLVRAVTDSRRAIHRFTLFSYERPDPATAVVLETAFSRVLLGPRATVPFTELVELLQDEHPEDFCIAAQWIEDAKAVALWRGDFARFAVQLAWFRAPGAPEPDPARLSIEDYGRTLRMGDYEASFDAVLYEHVAAARRRIRARMRKKDRTLGGSIRRLRELRGMRRHEFGEIDEKTIARIERGEVKKPQRATLKAIASQLAVPVEELETY